MSDNGPQFISSEFQTFLSNNGVKHIKSSPYHPASNGAAERLVQTLKTAVEKGKKGNMTLQHCVHNFQFCYRSTPQSTTGKTPAELFLRRQFKTRLSLTKPSFTDSMQQRQDKQQSKQAEKMAPVRCFLPKQKVLVRNHRGGEAVKWVPGTIVKGLGPVTYLVKVYGKMYKRHVNQMITTETEMRNVSDEFYRDASDVGVVPNVSHHMKSTKIFINPGSVCHI